MDYSSRQDKRNSKKKQSNYSIYSSKHIRAAEALIEKRLETKQATPYAKQSNPKSK
jgi:hypothetical protein